MTWLSRYDYLIGSRLSLDQPTLLRWAQACHLPFDESDLFLLPGDMDSAK